MASGDDSTLVKIAVFGVAFSIVVTVMITFFVGGQSDYDYDTIRGYQGELVDFGGEGLLNETPWVLSHVYTPFDPSIPQNEYPNHRDEAGWLFGNEVTNYPELGKAAYISLDKNQKSNQLLTIGNPVGWEYRDGKEWWNGGNQFGITVADPWLANIVTFGHAGDGYTYTSGSANNWNYTGYRYVFDPTLPFSTGTSSKDGQLSIVWYLTGKDTGISGGLDIYNSNSHSYGSAADDTRLASVSASTIITAVQSSGGYTGTINFDFQGTTLHLTISFSPTVYDEYPSLRAAWDDGAWQMAISSVSAGNFFDVDNSNTFVNTAGGMVDTFVQIYTFSYPEFDDEPWANVVLWLMCGLPMTLGMLLVTMRLVGGVFKFF